MASFCNFILFSFSFFKPSLVTKKKKEKRKEETLVLKEVLSVESNEL